MWRRLFTFSAAVSAVLFIMVCALWIRSYWIADSLEISDRGRMGNQTGAWRLYTYAQSCHGRMRFDCERLAVTDPQAAEILLFNPCAEPTHVRRAEPATPELYRPRPHEWAGFSASRDGSLMLISFPHWALALVALGLPICFARSVRRERRSRRAGCCLICGYDLRASLARCPECGTSVRAESPAAASPAAGEDGGGILRRWSASRIRRGRLMALRHSAKAK